MANASTAQLDALFRAVRESASRACWSRGVELVRAGAASRVGEDRSEITLRVAVPGAVVHPTVTLTPEDEDWLCDCKEQEDPCAHVAAAVIALRRAAKEGREEHVAGRAARVRYALTRRDGGLQFERLAVQPDGASEPLRATLVALAAGRVRGPEVAATQADLAVERSLGTRLWGALPRESWPRVLEALSSCPDVRLDDEPVRASGDPVRPRVVVEDREGDFWIGFARDRSIEEQFAGGLVLRDGVLRPLAGSSGLLGRELELLERGHRIAADQAATLVTELIPAIEGRVDLDVRTTRLPATTRETPRVQIDVERREDALSVLPTLVYGDPPRARVDAGRLVHLTGPVPFRDEAAERQQERELRQSLGMTPGHRVDLRGEDAVAFAERLRGWSGPVRGGAHEAFFRAAPLTPELRMGEADFELTFASPGEDGRPRAAEPGAVLRAWREGESLVPLQGGGFAPLPADWLARFGPILTDLQAARAADGGLPTCALPDLARLCTDLDIAPPPACDTLRALIDDFDGIPDAAPPADCTATLRPYQRDGLRWLRFLQRAGLGALLADDMGLGKTLQTLCALEGRSLVVAPTSVLFNWAEEVRRFRPALAPHLYYGPKRELDPDAPLTLTSYALLRLDAEHLAAAEWDCVVLDEAQQIKNPDSQVARAAYGLRAGFRVALSGTPVENRLEELWSQLHFANPGLLGSRAHFDATTARPIAAGDEAAEARLRQRLRPFVLRRTKREVAPELPPRTDTVLRCELDENERAVYDALQAATRKEVASQLAAGGSVLAALEALLRLRQACCHTGLIPGQAAAGSSKLALLRSELETAVADGHKALVFSQWTSLLDRVEPELERAGIPRLRLDGSTRDRQAVVEGFQADDGPPVLLVSLKAGGTGLNLTAADHVFLLDPWWNPAVEDQAADRTHRIGQDKPVLVYRMVARDTVEERILALQERKRALADAALGEGGGGAGLSREDLLALLQ